MGFIYLGAKIDGRPAGRWCKLDTMVLLVDINFRARTGGDVRTFSVGTATDPGEVRASAGFEGADGGVASRCDSSSSREGAGAEGKEKEGDGLHLEI